MRAHVIVSSLLATAVALLVAILGRDASDGRRLAWVDRAGRVTRLPAPPRAYAYPRLSPDGRQLALDVRDEPNGLWIWDFARNTLTPSSVGRASDIAPVWARSGEWLLFARGRGVAPGLWTLETGPRVRRLPTDYHSLLMPTSLLPGDRAVLVTTTAPSGFDILSVDLQGDSGPTTFVASPADDLNADVAPDGKWVAYQSRRPDQFEVWLRPVGEGAVDLRVTTAGGTRPVWTKDGRELVYLDADGAMIARSVDTSSPVPVIGEPQPLFTVDMYVDLVGRTFDVTSDGERFLVILNR